MLCWMFFWRCCCCCCCWYYCYWFITWGWAEALGINKMRCRFFASRVKNSYFTEQASSFKLQVVNETRRIITPLSASHYVYFYYIDSVTQGRNYISHNIIQYEIIRENSYNQFNVFCSQYWTAFKPRRVQNQLKQSYPEFQLVWVWIHRGCSGEAVGASEMKQNPFNVAFNLLN